MTSHFGYVEFRISQSISSIPLDFEITRLTCSSEQEMYVNVVHSPQRHAPKIVEQEKPVRRKSRSRKQGDEKQLLRFISDML